MDKNNKCGDVPLGECNSDCNGDMSKCSAMSKESIRDEIIRALRYHEARLDDIRKEEITTEGYIIREEANRKKTFNQILSLKLGSYSLKELEEKQDRICIKAEDQSLPKHNLVIESYETDVYKIGVKAGYKWGQNDLLNNNWVKVE